MTLESIFHAAAKRIAPVAAAAVAAVIPLAHAEGPRPAAPTLPLYQQECAACHLAFPPALLSAASWQHLMSGLPRHFGTDASLDAATHQILASWLTVNAGTYRKVVREAAPPPQDRITRAAWFVREHGEVPAAAWARPAIKSAANCAACHPRAEQGEFSEHDIRIPR